MSAPPRDRLPSALRLGDRAIGLFALWTLCANAAVAAGLGLGALVVGFAAVAVALGWSLRARARRSDRSAAPPDRGPLPGATSNARPNPRPRGGAMAAYAVGCALALGALHASSDIRAFWWIAVALLAGAVALSRRDDEEARTPVVRDAHWLWAAALGGALLASFAQRPDADDALYLNLAAAAAQHPSLPLLASDTLHGIEGLPLTLPVYRIHSIELAWAALAWITGREVLDFAHIVTPAVGGALAPLALARLLRLLLPERWPWALVASIGLLLLAGGAVHGYGSFHFVRLHQGKAMLVAIAVPWIAARAIEFGRSPSRSGWLGLASAQLAAVGLSATGLWLGPLVAGLGLLASRAPSVAALRPGLVGLTASLYPLLAGGALRGQTAALFDAGTARGEFPTLTDAALARSAIEPILGGEPLASLLLGFVLLAPMVAPTALGRRFCGIFALGFLLILWNPFSANTVASELTGPGTYWRIFWALPLPIFVGALATALPRTNQRPLPVSPAALGALACLAVLAVVPRSTVATAENGVDWSAPGWRIPKPVVGTVEAVRAHTRTGAAVLLPLDVAPWVTGFSDSPSPLVVRPDYLGVLRAKYPTSELDRRSLLARIVSGEAQSGRAAEALRRAIDDYALEAVGLGGGIRANRQVETALRIAGFQVVYTDASHVLWSLPVGDDRADHSK